MTRLFEPQDPYPRKLLELGIALAMPLWMEGMDVKAREIWAHTRRWERLDTGSELELVALVMAQVSIEFFQKSDDDSDETGAHVRTYARDYLQRVVRHGDGFLGINARDLADDIAQRYSVCLTIHTNVQGGSWYVLGTPSTVEHELLRFTEDPILARFAERFKEQYPKTVARLELASDMPKAISEIAREINALYEAARSDG